MVHSYAQSLPSFGLFTALDLPPEGALRTPQQGMQGLSAQWRREVQIGCGLQNLGNSCYLNSVLQCLAHLPPLANISLAKQHSRSCKLSKENRPCICCTFERQILSILTSSQHSNGYRGAVAPSAIYNSVHNLNKSLQRGRQEDSHELLRSLVDAMERNLLRQAGNYNPQRPPKHPRTLVNALFGGILQSQVRCLVCGHVSATWDPCMDISLELGAACSSVEDALGRFTAVEKLDGDNKYRCEGCKQLVPAHKQMTVYDDPNVLVIHLKRFDGIFGAKISKEIAFSETLDVEPYICQSRRYHNSSNGASSSSSNGLMNGCGSSSSGYSSSNGHNNSSSINNAVHSNGSSRGCGQQQQQQQQDVRSSPGHYVLHGVLVHHGYSANSGHYLAYVKDGVPPTGHWHCMNDSQVYRVNVPTVLKQQAYMLFYVRTSMKQQAHMPRQTEQNAAAAAALGSPGRLKRNSSLDAGQQQQQQQQQMMIGPQLPSHLLAKRQRLQEEPSTPDALQQQEQHQQEEGGSEAMQLCAQQQQQQQQQHEQQEHRLQGPVFGPQLPPWYSSRRKTSSDQDQPVTAADAHGGGVAAANGRAGGSKTNATASGAVTAAAGHQYFAWARHQQLENDAKQQQQQPPEAPNPMYSQPEQQQPHQQQQQQSGVDADTSDALIQQVVRAGVTEGVEGIACELRAWLTAQLKEAKQEGVTYEQCKALYSGKLKQHHLLRGLAQRLLQTLIDRFASSSAKTAG